MIHKQRCGTSNVTHSGPCDKLCNEQGATHSVIGAFLTPEKKRQECKGVTKCIQKAFPLVHPSLTSHHTTDTGQVATEMSLSSSTTHFVGVCAPGSTGYPERCSSTCPSKSSWVTLSGKSTSQIGHTRSPPSAAAEPLEASTPPESCCVKYTRKLSSEEGLVTVGIPIFCSPGSSLLVLLSGKTNMAMFCYSCYCYSMMTGNQDPKRTIIFIQQLRTHRCLLLRVNVCMF